MSSPSELSPESDLDAILREGPWIRRLAGGLLGNDAAADDLSQEVLAVALTARPAVEAAGLRSWLRTVARRLATRQRDRDRSRVRVEQRVARPESIGHEDDIAKDARQRLALYRRLSAAIDELEPAYRTALVLRYLEGLPPREIAVRLDVPVTTARKRVSRGLAMLRARLDADEHSVGESWSVAVATLLLPAGTAVLDPVPVSSTAASVPTVVPTLAWGGGLALLATMTPKTILSLLAALALVGLVLLARPSGMTSLEGTGIDGADARVAPKSDRSAARFVADAEDARESHGKRSAIPASAPAAAPRVRVEREDGGSLEGLGVAWIDRAGHPHELKLDAGSSALRPMSSAGARFFAWAPGCGGAYASAGEATENVTLVLPPGRVLRGRVVEDGGPPSRSVRLWALDFDRADGLSGDEGYLRGRLEALGAICGTADCWTRPDGSFALVDLTPNGTGKVSLPPTHRPIVDGVPGRSSGTGYDAETVNLVIETVLLPSVVGRLVWRDDGSPVVGALWVSLEDKESGNTSMGSVSADPNGDFAVGLRITDRALLQEPAQRAGGLLLRSARIGVENVNGISMSFDLRVELAGQSFPLDLGVLPVTRANSHPVRVVGPGGAPIAGATVVSGASKATTDAQGCAELSCAIDDKLEVLAAGYAYAVFPASADPPTSRRNLSLSLGSTLAVRTAAEGDAPEARLLVQLEWEESPFEGAHMAGAPPLRPLPRRIQLAFHRGDLLEGSYSHVQVGAPGRQSFRVPASGELIVPGLRAGSSFDLRTVDVLHQPIATRTVTMPVAPGTNAVDLSQESLQACRLRVRLVDPEGHLVGDGSIFVGRIGGDRSQGFSVRQGMVDVWPFAAGDYRLLPRIDGYLRGEVREYSLELDAPVLELEVVPARRLEVLFTDPAGRLMTAQSVQLEGPDGWRASDPDLSPGRAFFDEAPRCELAARLTIGTRTFTESVATDVELATLTLPAHGRLEVHLAGPPQLAQEYGDLRLRVREREGPKQVTIMLHFTDDATGAMQLGTELLPGAYDLELDVVERPTHSLATDEPLLRSLKRCPITITAGQLLRIDVRK